MPEKTVSPHSALLSQIAAMKVQKEEQETALKKEFDELVMALNPVTLVKEALHDLSDDRVVRMDLTKLGMNAAANMIIDKVVGKEKGGGRLVAASLIEVASTALINDHADEIVSGIRGWIASCLRK